MVKAPNCGSDRVTSQNIPQRKNNTRKSSPGRGIVSSNTDPGDAHLIYSPSTVGATSSTKRIYVLLMGIDLVQTTT